MSIDLQPKTAFDRWYEKILNKTRGNFLHRTIFVLAALMLVLAIVDSIRRQAISPTFPYSLAFAVIGLNLLERTIAKRAFERILGAAHSDEQGGARQAASATTPDSKSESNENR